ncbi:putative transcription factor btf3 [Talaromyces proteolyticus]|uniref:Transcription factor btf3 n=1 Tax=Talaromyces proteolyticus TaxID=1131652 RepID=A0AAD4PTB9_9EURO|nr:putative transcription factor btf3 [Talaromyces proteolyticus]KAH8693045.1 putative transcription factor btf3 [Talaromyces proteolyticus]
MAALAPQQSLSEMRQSGATSDHVVPALNGKEGSASQQHLEVICGPLLNYQRMDLNESSTWYGSVLIVTNPSHLQPHLILRTTGPVSENDHGTETQNQSTSTFQATKIYEDSHKAFWRYSLSLPLVDYEARWEYTIPGFHYVNGSETPASWSFSVPAQSQSMRLMFHSCNGFSVGTDTDSWAGPALWNDVLRVHSKRPFHVMIGGGDQIYNDGIRVDGPLRKWTEISNPHKRRTHDFDGALREECDEYYYNNYVRWYGHEPFKTANGQIPQINIWDDHDIIDGFGSYTDHFMKCAVFRGIGGVAFKYYCLFQHHIAPPKSTFTTDAPVIDPRQLADTFVLEEEHEDPRWIMGLKPGPYVEEKSRSLYMRLGRRIAFVGIDARTERTRHQVNYPETYDAIFNRLDQELAGANGEIKHLILLLGVPIAYPRLAWLENIFSSPLIAPIRLLNKRFGVAGGLFNKFDGQVDLLDDLDDHYTAKHHKVERRELMQRLQQFSKRHAVRVTILGGDVHLAALGRFYSNLDLHVPVENDHRFMVNIVSSAITNKPPPKAVANLLARRNKIHHLDPNTDETLMALFDKQPGGVEKGADWNNVTMPSRNYACITEIDTPPNGASVQPHSLVPTHTPKSGHSPLHTGEENVGTVHVAADGFSNSSDLVGGLDVAIRVEIEQGNRDGNTEGYGLSSKHSQQSTVDEQCQLTFFQFLRWSRLSRPPSLLFLVLPLVLSQHLVLGTKMGFK